MVYRCHFENTQQVFWIFQFLHKGRYFRFYFYLLKIMGKYYSLKSNVFFFEFNSNIFKKSFSKAKESIYFESSKFILQDQKSEHMGKELWENWNASQTGIWREPFMLQNIQTRYLSQIFVTINRNKKRTTNASKHSESWFLTWKLSRASIIALVHVNTLICIFFLTNTHLY